MCVYVLLNDRDSDFRAQLGRFYVRGVEGAPKYLITV